MGRIVFVRFLDELNTPKRRFEIYWPLEELEKLHTVISTHSEKKGKCLIVFEFIADFSKL